MSLDGIQNANPNNPKANEWMKGDIIKTRSEMAIIWIFAIVGLYLFIVIMLMK